MMRKIDKDDGNRAEEYRRMQRYSSQQELGSRKGVQEGKGKY